MSSVPSEIGDLARAIVRHVVLFAGARTIEQLEAEVAHVIAEHHATCPACEEVAPLRRFLDE